MKRPVALLAALVGLAIIAPSADAAAPKCTRGGAKVLATSGKTSVVSITSRSNKESAYGCWTPTGKRFKLFGNLEIDEATEWSIVGGRYIGVLRSLHGRRRQRRDRRQELGCAQGCRRSRARKCDGIVENPDDDESGTAGGPWNVMFFNGGGLAYTCAGNMLSYIADAKGERNLEPNGTVVTSFAVTPRGDRLFYLAGDTAKSIGV